jgi:putative spermidine/putrescine transport system permease protein
VFEALAADMKQAMREQTATRVASRINFEHGGLRSVFMKTTRTVARTEQGPWKPLVPGVRPRLGEPRIWSVLAPDQPPRDGRLPAARGGPHARRGWPPHARARRARASTSWSSAARWWVGLLVTLLCLAIGYPLAVLDLAPGVRAPATS